MKEIALYIHIPYCNRKCLYCDFNSYAGKDNTIAIYIDVLIKELKQYNEEGYNYKTVFIGGGTPTYIDAKYILRIMEIIGPHILKNSEITIECNPGTLTRDKLAVYKAAGINRISIGLQAWQDELLKKLGRIHNRKQFLESYEMIKTVGINNISIDLMFGLPTQAMSDWMETLNAVTSLDIKHISAYGLIIEEGTAFDDLYKTHFYEETEENIERSMYYTAVEHLEKKGFHQYEISNFAKDGYNSQHNIIYWKCEEYIGVGAGATSRIDNRRFSNARGIEEYINGIEAIDDEILSITDNMWETLFMGLRLTEGINIIEFQNKYKMNFQDVYGSILEKLKQDGLIDIKENNLLLTAKGIDLSNQVFVQLGEVERGN